MIRIEEIEKITREKNQIKKETYTKIYEQISRKIRHSVEIGIKSINAEIPMFVLGYPTYDRSKATHYIKRQFENSGFNVRFHGDYGLKISWLVKHKTEKKEEEEFPTLVNLKKTADQYRKYAIKK